MEIFMSLFFCIVIFAIVFPIIKEYFITRPFKEKYVTKAFLDYNKNIVYKYRPKSNYTKNLNEVYCLFPSRSIFIETDLIIDENLISYDLYAYHNTGGKNNSRITDFKGRFFICKNINLETNFLLLEHDRTKYHSDLEPLELEVIDFNNKFNLYVDNKEKAFSVFSPSVIKKLLMFEEKYYGKLIIGSLDNNLVLGINNNANYFEDNKDIEKIKSEYLELKNIILELIDLLK